MESRLLSDIYRDIILSGKDTRFKAEAYGFVLAGLDFHRSKCESEGHIEAVDLVEAIVELALLKFGPTAGTVFENWGITQSVHIGNIVYNLIDLNILTKTDDDKLEQFITQKTLQEYLQSGNLYKINKKMIKTLNDS